MPAILLELLEYAVRFVGDGLPCRGIIGISTTLHLWSLGLLQRKWALMSKWALPRNPRRPFQLCSLLSCYRRGQAVPGVTAHMT